MLGSILKPVLLRFLHDYVEDASHSLDINVSLLSGSLALENLVLKPPALESALGLGLLFPVHIRSINMASVKADLPVTRLTSRAGHVDVSKLHICLDWREERGWDELETRQALALAAVDSAGALWQTALGGFFAAARPSARLPACPPAR
jgi:hypothetical protein